MKLEIINCPHWSKGSCLRGYYGGRPSAGTCQLACPEYRIHNASEAEPIVAAVPPKVRQYRWCPNHRGVGDTVKWAIKVVSFGLIKQKKDCGCKNRQNWLNRKFPYPWRDCAEQRRKLDN